MSYMSFENPTVVIAVVSGLLLVLSLLAMLAVMTMSERQRLKRIGAKLGLDERGKVVTVDLEGAQITDDQLRCLERTKTVQRLWLNETAIGDDGIAHLRPLTNLQELGLYQTQVTDACIEVLEQLRNLRSVVLEGTKVTEQGISRLKQSLPNCRVITG